MSNPSATEPPHGTPDDPFDAAPGGPPKRDLSALPAFLRRAGSDEASDGRTPEPILPGPRTRPVVVAGPDLGALPMAGISARKLLFAVAVLAMAWGVISFGRQVAAASAASAHAAELRAANTQLASDVDGLQKELQLVQEQRYIDQAARAFRLGTAQEVPFALQAGAPALPPDAPGSAAQRLGADGGRVSPLDAWLQVLFGPTG